MVLGAGMGAGEGYAGDFALRIPSLHGIEHLQEAHAAEEREREKAQELARRQQEEAEESRRYFEQRDAEEAWRSNKLEEEQRLRAEHQAKVEREHLEAEAAQAERERKEREPVEQDAAEESAVEIQEDGNGVQKSSAEIPGGGDGVQEGSTEIQGGGAEDGMAGDAVLARAMIWMVCMTEERAVGSTGVVAALLEEMAMAVEAAAASGASFPFVCGLCGPLC